MSKRDLYELVGDWAALQDSLDHIDDADPNELPGLEEALTEARDQIQGEVSDRIEGYIRVIRNAEALASAIKVEEARLNARRKAAENRIERIRQWIGSMVDMVPDKKVKTTLGTASIRKGPPSVVVDDVYLLPDGLGVYKLVDPVPVKARIKELIEANDAFPIDDVRRVANPVSGARLEPGGPVLTIR